jgi:hemophore-related protein
LVGKVFTNGHAVADQTGCRSWWSGIVVDRWGGVATADPDLGPVINTTCNYSQVLSALNAQSPAAAAQLNASPTAQSVLRGFLDSSPDQRQQIAQELQSRRGSQQYFR